jgi:hypothetical protein
MLSLVYRCGGRDRPLVGLLNGWQNPEAAVET